MKLMKKVSPQALILVVLTVLLTLNGALTLAVADQCQVERWDRVDNAPYTGLGYPETNTNYWVFRFPNTPGNHMAFKLSAEFPHARFMAYTLYNLDDNDDEGDVITFNDKVQHLADAYIQPLENHENPYLDGADRNAIVNRSYEIYVVHEDSDRILPDGRPMANTLVIPDDIGRASLFIRVYVPDNPDAPQGGVALPVITPYNELDGQEMNCPDDPGDDLTPDDVINYSRLNRRHILLPDDVIESWRAGDYGLFPNGDCPYLTTPLVLPVLPIWNDDKIAVLRFKAPTFADTRDGENFSSSDEVRYWSVCMGDWVYTNTSECIADEEAIIDEDGYVHLVIGPDFLVAESPKWTNLPRGRHVDPVLVFRQISPRDFEGSFMNVDIAFDETDQNFKLDELYQDEEGRKKTAYNSIGEYGPRGTYCTKSEFLSNHCGMD